MPITVKSKLYIFADDAKLYREITSIKDVKLLQEDLKKTGRMVKKNVFYISMKINVYI